MMKEKKTLWTDCCMLHQHLQLYSSPTWPFQVLHKYKY